MRLLMPCDNGDIYSVIFSRVHVPSASQCLYNSAYQTRL
jgi:hypothetical protein